MHRSRLAAVAAALLGLVGLLPALALAAAPVFQLLAVTPSTLSQEK
jgi:hypothetical protein